MSNPEAPDTNLEGLTQAASAFTAGLTFDAIPDEAVYLADRILVLKAHPGEVLELIEVPVPQPRSTEQFLSPEFLATKKRLEELIHPVQTEAPSGDHLNMVRMVSVSDEVESVF